MPAPPVRYRSSRVVCVRPSVSPFFTFMSPKRMEILWWNWSQLITTMSTWHWEDHWFKGEGQPAVAIWILWTLQPLKLDLQQNLHYLLYWAKNRLGFQGHGFKDGGSGVARICCEGGGQIAVDLVMGHSRRTLGPGAAAARWLIVLWPMRYWSKELWVVDICTSWSRRLHNIWFTPSEL